MNMNMNMIMNVNVNVNMIHVSWEGEVCVVCMDIACSCTMPCLATQVSQQ